MKLLFIWNALCTSTFLCQPNVSHEGTKVVVLNMIVRFIPMSGIVPQAGQATIRHYEYTLLPLAHFTCLRRRCSRQDVDSSGRFAAVANKEVLGLVDLEQDKVLCARVIHYAALLPLRGCYSPVVAVKQHLRNAVISLVSLILDYRWCVTK